MKRHLLLLAAGLLLGAASAFADGVDPLIHIACAQPTGKPDRCEKTCLQSIKDKFDKKHPAWSRNCRGFAGRKCSFGDLTGRLTSCLNNQPISQVRIISQGKRAKVVRTNANGEFVISRLARGSYTVWATRPLKKPAKLANCLKVNPLTTQDLGTICVCPPDTAQCGNTCCQIKTDEQNCGRCGNVCGSGSACVEGSCESDVPDINITKLTNGEDADIIPGPIVLIGSAISWTYIVENRGSFPLFEIAVDDDAGAVVSCPATELAVGASMTCTASGIAQGGQYSNTGIVTARTADGRDVGATDMSHYFGKLCPTCGGTVTPTGTPSGTVSPTTSATPSVSVTPTLTASATVTGTPNTTLTATATPSVTATWTPTVTPTVTPTWTPTVTPTWTPTWTPTPTNTP